MDEMCSWCGHPGPQHHVEPAIKPDGPVLAGDRHACLRCHVCYPDRDALATTLQEDLEAARRQHVDEMPDRGANSPGLLAIVDAHGRLEGQEAAALHDVQRAIDRLRRVARDMEVNADEAIRAGLQGDARRWRVVRNDVAAALELLGAQTAAAAARELTQTRQAVVDARLMTRALEACATLLRDTHRDAALVIDQSLEGGHVLASDEDEVLYEWEPMDLSDMVDRLERYAYDHSVRDMGLTEAAIEEHYAQHPHARLSLAEVARALASQDRSPLASRPELIERAAAQVLALHPNADADDVLLWAEAQQFKADLEDNDG